MTQDELINFIKSRLGYPMVRVELDNCQIIDNILYARDKFIKWATGNATKEVFMSIPLSGGQTEYELPSGVVDVVNYDEDVSGGGINTLFTAENYMYNMGMLDGLIWSTSTSGHSLISYHLAKDFLSMWDSYQPKKFNWKYNKYRNILQIIPAPDKDEVMVLEDENGEEYTINSPGFIMLQTYMIDGAYLDGEDKESVIDDLYEEDWIKDYATALSKKTLGLVRRKFSNFQSIGNTGISLDGDSLLSEAKDELEDLEERLRKEEPHIGYGILVG